MSDTFSVSMAVMKIMEGIRCEDEQRVRQLLLDEFGQDDYREVQTRAISEPGDTGDYERRYCGKKIPERLPQAAVLQLIEQLQSGGGSAEAAAEKNKGGRHPDHNWDAIWEEIAVLVAEDGVPASNTKFAIAITQRLEAAGLAIPDARTIEKKTAKFHHRLKQAGQTKPLFKTG